MIARGECLGTLRDTRQDPFTAFETGSSICNHRLNPVYFPSNDRSFILESHTDG